MGVWVDLAVPCECDGCGADISHEEAVTLCRKCAGAGPVREIVEGAGGSCDPLPMGDGELLCLASKCTFPWDGPLAPFCPMCGRPWA